MEDDVAAEPLAVPETSWEMPVPAATAPWTGELEEVSPDTFDGPMADEAQLADPDELADADDVPQAAADELTDTAAHVDELAQADADATADADDVPQAAADAGDAGLQTELDALGAIEAELADVELALRRLDEGSYGRCEVCDGTIDETRLAEAPAARFCRAHLPIALG